MPKQAYACARSPFQWSTSAQARPLDKRRALHRKDMSKKLVDGDRKRSLACMTIRRMLCTPYDIVNVNDMFGSLAYENSNLSHISLTASYSDLSHALILSRTKSLSYVEPTKSTRLSTKCRSSYRSVRNTTRIKHCC